MNILVSGGAGYIGSIVTEQLIERGEKVVVVDNLFQGHREAVHPEAEFVQTDLADREVVCALFENQQIDAVMHFASHTLVGESMQQPFLYLRRNLITGTNLMEAAAEYGTRRFILSSTANLFDDPQEIPIDEEERLVPGSPYGESKLMLERCLQWMDRIYGMRYAALRYFNACGASERYGEDHDPETHLIPLVLQVAQGKRDRIEIYGTDYDTPDGTPVRDYIHVLDLAEAHILALHALDGSSRVYNLGNGRGFSVREVIDVARRVTGHPIPVREGQRRAGDPAVLVASSDKIRRELGWQARYPDLEAIIDTAWRWHQRHPNGYAS